MLTFCHGRSNAVGVVDLPRHATAAEWAGGAAEDLEMEGDLSFLALTKSGLLDLTTSND